MVILGYHAPVPPPKWDDHHVRIIRDASNKVIHHRKSSEQFKPVTTSQSHFAHPLHAPTVQVVDHGTATYEELHGNFFTSHRDLRRCMGKHTRIVVPKDPVPEPYRQRGRRGCKETALRRLVTQRRPPTQWQNHPYGRPDPCPWRDKD
ncbi:hypothetical protein JL721_11167 [Aureococcus anophagefferens]|nr:hypothetical protein JL721_11167 [Aureococcus anophagefferens]